ncbi:411_t:CDS:1, partial [Funneliformis mosseae]
MRNSAMISNEKQDDKIARAKEEVNFLSQSYIIIPSPKSFCSATIKSSLILASLFKAASHKGCLKANNS